jgi:hypothetical protein
VDIFQHMHTQLWEDIIMVNWLANIIFLKILISIVLKKKTENHFKDSLLEVLNKETSLFNASLRFPWILGTSVLRISGEDLWAFKLIILLLWEVKSFTFFKVITVMKSYRSSEEQLMATNGIRWWLRLATIHSLTISMSNLMTWKLQFPQSKYRSPSFHRQMDRSLLTGRWCTPMISAKIW